MCNILPIFIFSQYGCSQSSLDVFTQVYQFEYCSFKVNII